MSRALHIVAVSALALGALGLLWQAGRIAYGEFRSMRRERWLDDRLERRRWP